MKEWTIRPDANDPRLTQSIDGIDHHGQPQTLPVVIERDITLYLNKQEIVTLMTIGDHPDYLAVGFLLNQNMLKPTDKITAIDFDDDLGVVVVRTDTETNYEHKLQKRIRTSGCAQGTVFGDIMEKFSSVMLSDDTTLRTSWLYSLFSKINHCPSLYLTAGAVHGCVLCEEDTPLLYMEDVGRHNAIDKIAGYMYMHNISSKNKMFYTTGRLTTEMVIKCVQMEIPILISRSGFTSAGVELARKANLTLIGRAKGKRFIALSGFDRIKFDVDPNSVELEDKHARKSSIDND
jgi:FdhD protein